VSEKDAVGGESALARPETAQVSEEECGTHAYLGTYLEPNSGWRFNFVSYPSMCSHADV
jgi:hypothetical protein